MQKQRELVRDLERAAKSAKPDTTPTPPDPDPDVDKKGAAKREQAAFRVKFLDDLIEADSAMLRQGVWDDAKYALQMPPKDRKEKVVEARLKEVGVQRPDHSAPWRRSSTRPGRAKARSWKNCG